MKWELVDPTEPEPNVVKDLAPLQVRFLLNLRRSVRKGNHGILLYNNDNQIVWSGLTPDLEMETGMREFVYSFPMLPLKPGVYHWFVSLCENRERLDEWLAVPPLIIAAPSTSHPQERLQGLINLPWEIKPD